MEEYREIANLVKVSTDTGAVGFHGFVTQLYDPADYDVVLVCGPTVMMRAARLCAEKGTPALSAWKRRWPAASVPALAAPARPRAARARACARTARYLMQRRCSLMADLKTNLLGFVMNSPVIGASGTVGYGVEYEELADFAKIGGISGKGLTLHGQYGNKGERLWETPSGLINSIGLQNPGVQHFIDVELPEMLELKQKYGTVAIANLGGHSEEEYVEGAAMLSDSAVDIVELNISCPNVKVGGMAYGVKAEAAGEVVRMVRAACKKPLMVKLSPQAENIPEMCKAVEAAGADAISLTNTFQACAIDLEKRRPVFNNIFAGLSGPAVRPIALRMVWQAVGAVNIPVVGLGGIATGRDALEFIMAGAAAVQVGAANFANPRAMETIADEMAAWMDKNGVKTLDEIRGCARNAE